MISRLIACGALVCCLFAGDAAASADRADAKLFKGKTSQGYRIKAQVKEQAFRIHVFDIDLRCRDGSELALIESGFLWTKVGKRGSFRDAQFGRTDSVYFRGRLNERRLRGRLRVTDRLRNGTRCVSRWIVFNATPRGGGSAGDAAASADRANAKLFQGTTGMGYRIKVLVKGQAFKVKLFRVDVRCRDERQLTLTKRGFPWTKVGKSGKFRANWSRGGESVLFRGRLNERNIWGAVRVADRLGDGTRCSSYLTTFGATPR